MHHLMWRKSQNIPLGEISGANGFETFHLNSHSFSLKKAQQGVTLLLMMPLDGPQDIELELTMNVFTQNRQPSGSSVAKIFLLVSEFPF